MKDPKAWELDDLHELISTHAEESSTLEFKRGQVLEDLDNQQLADRRKEEISKDVSAFANRMGGVIVYGMEEDNDEPHPAKDFSPVNPTKCSKERLEQIIASRIKPPIPNLVIRSIHVRSDACVYVVTIPSSHTAHQASDKRYYRRANFSNQMMDDDEIRQTMNRRTKPTYRAQLAINVKGEKRDLWISVSVQNTSVMIGNDISAVLLLPSELGVETPAGTEVIDRNTFVRRLNAFRTTVPPQLRPFESLELRFENVGSIPSEPPSWTVPLFVRVYDQFGQAHEAEFVMSLREESLAKIISEQQ